MTDSTFELELPNGMKVFCQNQAEAREIYRQVAGYFNNKIKMALYGFQGLIMGKIAKRV